MNILSLLKDSFPIVIRECVWFINSLLNVHWLETLGCNQAWIKSPQMESSWKEAPLFQWQYFLNWFLLAMVKNCVSKSFSPSSGVASQGYQSWIWFRKNCRHCSVWDRIVNEHQRRNSEWFRKIVLTAVVCQWTHWPCPKNMGWTLEDGLVDGRLYSGFCDEWVACRFWEEVK